jgi:SNF2 family DNA or RNA helicase
MTSDLLGKEVIDIIKTAKKRTILFSSYVDSLAMAEDVCRQAGLQPMVIDGSNSKQVKDLLDEFRSNENINPLIASTKVMSTGHTIVECNTVIFLNVPFRSVDYYQASDRVYRIGQDTDVYIYKLVLDTGTKENLSTRMQDILVWSKGQFNEIMGESDDLPDNMHGDVKNMIQRLDNPDESIFDICKQAIKKIFS